MKSLLWILPTVALSFLTACGCSREPEGQSPDQGQGGSGSAQDAPAVIPSNPFAPGVDYEPTPVTTLPDHPFFVTYRYPGTKVVNVQTVFNSPTAWFTSTDEFDKIDAFYAKLFTDSEGKVHGSTGRYFRLADDGRRERVSIKQRTGGGCEVIISN